MVLHHVVSAKELVLLLDGRAIYNEVVTEMELVEELERVFVSTSLQGRRRTELHKRPI